MFSTLNVLRWKYPELKQSWMDERNDYYITNDNSPTKIFEWYTDKYPKPSDEQLEQWYQEFKYLAERRYPPITDQLDALWHDLNDGNLDSESSTWFAMVKSVKDASPKSS